jgi:hypothetical protein
MLGNTFLPVDTALPAQTCLRRIWPCVASSRAVGSAYQAAYRPNGAQDADINDTCSGIFGYINYLVEKDRKYILDTLVNGESQ